MGQKSISKFKTIIENIEKYFFWDTIEDPESSNVSMALYMSKHQSKINKFHVTHYLCRNNVSMKFLTSEKHRTNPTIETSLLQYVY
jgi:hypothetical protein